MLHHSIVFIFFAVLLLFIFRFSRCSCVNDHALHLVCLILLIALLIFMIMILHLILNFMIHCIFHNFILKYSQLGIQSKIGYGVHFVLHGNHFIPPHSSDTEDVPVVTAQGEFDSFTTKKRTETRTDKEHRLRNHHGHQRLTHFFPLPFLPIFAMFPFSYLLVRPSYCNNSHHIYFYVRVFYYSF